MTDKLDIFEVLQKINNHDVEGYKVTGGGKTVAIDGGSAKRWYDFIFQL